MKRTHLAIILLLFIIFTFSVISQASFVLAPNRFIFRIDSSNTNVLEVSNPTDLPMRVRVYPGKAPEQNQDEYLGDWLVIHPPIVTLAPGQTRGVRFSVRTPEGIADGEYRSLLYIEELPTERNGEDAGEGAIDFEMLTRMGINLYGQYGDLDYSGELTAVDISKGEDSLNITGEFINTGTAHIRMDAISRIIDGEGEVVAENKNSRFVVHRSASKDFREELVVGEDISGYQLEISFLRDDQVIDSYQRVLD